MSRSVRLSLFATFLAWFFAGANAQTLRIESFRLVSTRFPDIRGEFDLRSPIGDFVTSLQDSSVVVVEDGVERKVTLNNAAPPDGIAYVFAIDTSGSMVSTLSELRQSLAAFIDSLGSMDRVAVVSFAETPAVVAGFGSSRETCMEAVKGLEAKGRRTELFLGVFKALQQFEQGGLPARKILVLVSDGREEGSVYSIDDCIKKATDLGVNIVGVGVLSAEAHHLLNIEKLADMSGGTLVRVDAGPTMAARLASVGRYTRARHNFSFTSGLPADGLEHQTELRIKLGDTIASYKFPVKTNLAPPLSPPSAGLPGWVLPVGGAVILLGGGVIALLLIQARKSRREVAAALNAQQKLQLDSQNAIKQLEKATETIADRIATPAPLVQPEVVLPPVSDESTPVRPSKRSTVFSPGRSQAGGTAPPYRRALLQVVKGPLEGSQIAIVQGETKIGRDDDNDIVLDEDRVSRHHAAIICSGGVYYLKDLGSSNGTFVEGERIGQNPVPLHSGQVVQLGSGVLLRFYGER